MVEHTAVNRGVVGSSPTGGVGIHTAKLFYNTFSKNVEKKKYPVYSIL